MPLLKIKLFESDKLATLTAAVATFLAANAATRSSIRGQAVASFQANDGDEVIVKAMAWQGLILPASKTADVQHVTLVAQKLAIAQAALDAALAEVVHATVTDGVTSVAGRVTSVAAPFEAEDVGRKLRIIESSIAVEKTITVFNSSSSVDYDNAAGDFVAGTGKTVALLGAESMQMGSLSIGAFLANDGDTQYTIDVALEGQLPA